MKKLVALFVALMFLATFSLIGCNQSQPPRKARRRERPEPLEHLEHLEPRSTWSTGSSCASTRKIIAAGYRGISSPRGYTP